MKIPFIASPLSSCRALFLAVMTLAVVPACGGGSSGDNTTLSAEERQGLEQRIAELEAEAATLKAELERHHADAAASQQEKAELEAQVSKLTRELAEARALLESQDWEAVLVKLEATKTELTSLQARVATLSSRLQFTATLHFGDQPFELDKPYTLPGGEQLSFTELRYWLSNIKLLKQDGTSVALPDSYYLMDYIKEQDLEVAPSSPNGPMKIPAARREQVTVDLIPAGVYTGIEFSVGVDPYYNDNLSRQAGELHLAKNMTHFTPDWYWLTSYIFTKMKGSFVSADSSSSDTFSWETGDNVNFRTTRLDFSAPITVNAQKHLHVNLKADVARLFDNTYLPSAKKHISAKDGTERAVVSDAFKNMFSLTSAEAVSQW